MIVTRKSIADFIAQKLPNAIVWDIKEEFGQVTINMSRVSEEEIVYIVTKLHRYGPAGVSFKVISIQLTTKKISINRNNAPYKDIK